MAHRASMKGGFNNPPNVAADPDAQQRRPASMKGGFNNPPNDGRLAHHAGPEAGFNEGGVQ